MKLILDFDTFVSCWLESATIDVLESACITTKLLTASSVDTIPISNIWANSSHAWNLKFGSGFDVKGTKCASLDSKY